MKKGYNGFSISLVFGSWGGLYINFNKTHIRICLGYFAITFWFCDIEKVSEYWMDKAKNETKI